MTAERIQENLEDELLKSALEQGMDLRQYAQGVEDELHKVERASIQDCMWHKLTLRCWPRNIY